MNGKHVFTLLMILAFGFALPIIVFAQNQGSVENQADKNIVSNRSGQQPDINTVKGIAVVTKVDRPDNCLRIRNGPGSSYDIVGCARLGDQLELTGVWTSNNWAQLTGDGWVFGDQIETDLKPPLRVSGKYSVPKEPVVYGENIDTYPEYGYSTYVYDGVPLYVYDARIWHRYYPWRWWNAWWRKHHDHDWWERNHNHKTADGEHWRDRDRHRDGNHQLNNADLRDSNKNTANLTGRLSPNDRFRNGQHDNQNRSNYRHSNVNRLPGSTQNFESKNKMHPNTQELNRQSHKAGNIARQKPGNANGPQFRQFNNSHRHSNVNTLSSSSPNVSGMGRSFSNHSVQINPNIGSNRAANFSMGGASRTGAAFGGGSGRQQRR